MRRRAGRRRKVGRRKPSGDLVSAPRPMPAQIAARMPHRRALGEKAVDQLAESELAVWAAARGARARCWRPPGRTMRGIGGGTSRAFVLPEPL
jgi:hypothetical protein